MSQTIEISVKEKIAETSFREVVTFNSVYTLKFTFDGEWDGFLQRVAVVRWEGGCAEKYFEGTECEFPPVLSSDCEQVAVGVYSVSGDRRIASSFVRLFCRAGAHGVPSGKKSESFHEQILAALNAKDWSVFDDKAEAGIYSAVRVNEKGFVTEGWKLIEVGEDGQSAPDATLADGGVFFKRSGGVYGAYYNTENGLLPIPMESGKASHALSVGGKTYDGSAAVEVTADDLSLAAVATSGSYGDLSDKPVIPEVPVSSVNGETGDVVLTKESFGLGALTEHRQFPLSEGISEGSDMNVFRSSGVYFIRADDSAPVLNMPTSAKNTGPLDGEWILLVINYAEAGGNAIQLAISSRGDNAMRLRTYADGAFSAWKTVI